MMKVIDLSHDLSEDIPIIGSYPRVKIKELPSFSKISDAHSGGRLRWSVCEISLIDHAGTHIDAPFHIDPDGETIDKLPVSTFVRKAALLRLLDKKAGEEITDQELIEALHGVRGGIKKGDAVLLHTGWDRYWGTPLYFHNPGLSISAAEWLAEKKVSMIGIDTPNIDPGKRRPESEEPRPGHYLLLARHKIPHLENLCNLDQIRRLKVLLIALPLKLKGGTGSPVRAVAIEE